MNFFSQSPQEYQVYARLKGTRGPVNCLAFSHDSKILASGGDDESVRLWDIEEQKQVQVLSDRQERWGQITCLKWIQVPTNPAITMTLCIGTGRGSLLIYDKRKDSDTFHEVYCADIFPFNDPVESMDFDVHKGRIVVSSHGGKIMMYVLNKKGLPELMWIKNLFDIAHGKGNIPRTVQFVSSGESVLISGLESGIIFSKAAATGMDNWSKQLKSSIGNSCLSATGNYFLVDNLQTGFDLYPYPTLQNPEPLEITRSEPYLHGAVFVEGSATVACGSDHGKVYIYSMKTLQCLQKLRVGSGRSIVQAVDAVSCDKFHFLACGVSDRNPDIVVWKKMTKGPRTCSSQPVTCNSLVIIMLFNAMLLLALFAALLGGKHDLVAEWSSIHLSAPSKNSHPWKESLLDLEEQRNLRQKADEAMERYQQRMLERAVDIGEPARKERVVDDGKPAGKTDRTKYEVALLS